jgi:hypothetical protein
VISHLPFLSGAAASFLAQSKYPPAKPGALECWPLKAANGVADAAPGQAATEVASKRQRLNCTNIGQLFLVPDIGPYDLFSPPDVETKYPTRCSGQQNFFGIPARTWWANDALSLDKSDHPRSALFKGITIIL